MFIWYPFVYLYYYIIKRIIDTPPSRSLGFNPTENVHLAMAIHYWILSFTDINPMSITAKLVGIPYAVSMTSHQNTDKLFSH